MQHRSVLIIGIISNTQMINKTKSLYWHFRWW